MRRGQVAFVHFDHESGLDSQGAYSFKTSVCTLTMTSGWIRKVHTRLKSVYTTGNRTRASVSHPTGTVTRLLMSKSCSQCKQGPAAGSKMLTCGRCHGSFYCDSTYVQEANVPSASWKFLAVWCLSWRW